MKGQMIKEILKREGVTLSEVSRLLGFDSDQRLHSALKSDDIKTGLLEDIARVLNKSVGFFYAPSSGFHVPHGEDSSGSVNPSNSEIVRITCRFVSLLEKKDEQIDRLISLLENPDQK